MVNGNEKSIIQGTPIWCLKKWITETDGGGQTQKSEIMFPITPTDPSTCLISSVAFIQLDFEYTVFPLS